MFYDILSLRAGASPLEVLRAAKRCICEIDESDHEHKVSMKNYIKRICALLIHPSGRECYAYILKSRTTYVSPTKAKLMLKVIDSFNDGCGRALLPPSACKSLHVSVRNTLKPLMHGGAMCDKFRCRWCTETIKDKSSLFTLICKCSFRSGHEFCVKEFGRVHSRCPICRQQLLRRKGVSKYMLFNTDKMYEIN